jgi:hypothetical protein
MAGKMGHYSYTDDGGNVWRVRLDASNAAAMGGVAAPTGLTKPAGLVPRYILAEHPTTGRERRIVAPDPTNALWLGGTATISLIDFDTNDAVTFNIRGRIGEKRTARG